MRSRPLAHLKGPGVKVLRDAPVRRIVARAQEARPGDVLFLGPRAGARASGFVREAMRRGALGVFALADQAPQAQFVCAYAQNLEAAGRALARWFGGTPEMTRLVAIVGTDGKTSVAWFLRAALARAFGRAWARGTLGLVQDLRRWHARPNTTPGIVELHALWGKAVRQRVPWLVLEVSSHAIAQQRTAGLVFAGCIFTSLGRDHLDAHGDLASYWACKKGFVARLREAGARVVAHVRLAAHAPARTVFYGGMHEPAALQAEGRDGAVRLRMGRHEAVVARAPKGAIHAENIAAAALALVHIAGLSLAQAAFALADVPPPPGRMEEVAPGVFVDYAHTPEALRRALVDVRGFARGRVFVVFGCGGERDRGKRPEMGAMAAALADRIWITNDNPRREDPQAIAREIVAGMPAGACVKVQLDRKRAIAEALAAMEPGDVLLVAGKGAETEMEMGDARIPWDERAIVRTLAKEVRRAA